MAYLVSTSSGNLTSSSTWSLVDPTSLLNVNTASSATTTAGGNSTAFTPGAITISHIGFKVSFHNVTSPTNSTVTVELRQANVTVPGTSVTFDPTLIDIVTVGGHAGWFFVKLPTPKTLTAATAYTLFVSSGTASLLTINRTATATDWCRMLVTTTNQAPAAGDSLLIGGIIDGTTPTTITVTEDDNGVNIYGQVNVTKYGILSFPTAANSYFKLGGITPVDLTLTVFSSGQLILGTSSSPISSGNTSIIEFQSTTTGLYGLDVKNGGILTTYGAFKTQFQLLASNAAAAATSLTLNGTPTNWKSGDSIIVASTTVTAAQSELVALSADVSSTSASCGSLVNAHSGTSPTQGEVCNITRNVKIRGLNSTTGTGYITSEISALVSMTNTELYFLGANVANKNGAIEPLGSICSFTGCTFHDSTGTVRGFYTPSTTGGITLSNCTVWNVGSNGIDISGATTSGNNILDGCITIKCVANGFNIQDNGTSVTNCRAASSTSAGFLLSPPSVVTGTISNLIAHSNNANGIQIDTITSATLTNLTSWNNTSQGIIFSGAGGFINFINGTVFGNTTKGITANTTTAGKYYFTNFTSYNNTQAGVNFGTSNSDSYFFFGCAFGPNNVTADIQLSATLTTGATFNNCTFLSTTELSAQTNISGSELCLGVMMPGYQANPASHKCWYRNSIITSDSTIYNSAAPSERIAPNTFNTKSKSSSKFINLNSGDTSTISVFVYKNSAYDGNQPRLMLRQNSVMGITNDTILATAITVNGIWENLTGTTPAVTADGVIEIYVDLDGDIGWINVDDWGII